MARVIHVPVGEEWKQHLELTRDLVFQLPELNAQRSCSVRLYIRSCGHSLMLHV